MDRMGIGHAPSSAAAAARVAIAAVLIGACGGANEADVGEITGKGTSTPVVAFTATPVPTAVPIPSPPVVAPSEAVLFAGVGAAPDGCSGGSQSFQVTHGAPLFRIGAGDGLCVSPTTLATSDASFTVVAGDTEADAVVSVFDSLDREAVARVLVRVAPVAFLALDSAAEQRSDNGDATFTSVLGAVLSDRDGVAVPDGVPVEFSIVEPVAGVSVTSPGFTNQQAPCTPGHQVQAQPGDALSCIKYSRSLQGQTVRVRARVRGASGVLEDIEDVLLPDDRPTSTATRTPVPTDTPRPSPTPAAAQIQIAVFTEQVSDNLDGTLSGVLSALITDATGAAIGDGVPVQFRLEAPVPAGVSVTSPGLTGEEAPCTLGFPVAPQPGNALSCVKYDRARQGDAVTVRATVQTADGPLTSTQRIVLPDLRTATPSVTATPTVTVTVTPTVTPSVTPTPTLAAAHIQLALFVERAGDNGDGTLSSVIGALVTDARGATVGNGMAVQFRLVDPVPGVSVTSPGRTGEAAPCTLGFPVVPQPGDALSCIKYDRARQGERVTIEAAVDSPSGPLTTQQAITLPDLRPTATATGTPTTTPTATQPPAAMQFLGASPPNIGVRASGLPEQTTLRFRVTSSMGNAVPGVEVHFDLIGLDDETLDPSDAVTDHDGVALTTLTSGTRAASVRVIASADVDGDGAADLTAQSTAVTILGGPAAHARFSIAARPLNIAGSRFFGLRSEISAFVNDRFGNAVPPGTAVSFVSNGASVVGAGLTDADGVATASLISEASIPPSGIVTVLAFTRGEEDFIDNNGNGIYDPAVDTLVDEGEVEPFIDARPPPPQDAVCSIPPPSPLCDGTYAVGEQFDLFVDVNDNGIWDTQGSPGVWDTNIVVFDTIPVTFSGTLVAPSASPTTFAVPNGGAVDFTLDVHDARLNPIVGGSTIDITVAGGDVFGGQITVPDGESFNQIVPGLTRFVFAVADQNPDEMNPPRATSVVVTITSENGDGTFIVASGTID